MGTGKSDPMCCCQIVNREESALETAVKSKTLDPVWDEEHDIDYFEPGDDIVFSVYDHDTVGDRDLLGIATLKARNYDREGGFEGDLRLTNCGRGKNATLKVVVLVMPPEMPDGEPISVIGSRLMVKIISAEGLRA